MGGSDKGQKRANAKQSALNAENAKVMAADRLKMERLQRGTEYKGLFNERTSKARNDAQSAVTKRRTEGLKSNSKMIDDYHTQNRARLFRAKTGQGQAADDSITKEMIDNAQKFLDRDSDYWDSTRTVAGDKAYAEASEAYTKEYGSEEDFVGKGELSTAKRTAAPTKTEKASGADLLSPLHRIQSGYGDDSDYAPISEEKASKSKGSGSNSLFNKKNNKLWGSNSMFSLGG